MDVLTTLNLPIRRAEVPPVGETNWGLLLIVILLIAAMSRK